MKLSVWAKSQGLSYQTAWRMWREGKLPIPATQVPTATLAVEYIEMSLASAGRELIVVDDREIDDDLVQDMIDILTRFCARLYGRRGAKHRANKAAKAAAEADP